MSVQQSGDGQVRVAECTPETVTVALTGDFDLSNVARLRQALDAVLTERHPRVLVVDAAAVGFFDCASLRSLLELRDRARAPGLDCQVVISAASSPLTRLLDLLDLLDLVDLVEMLDYRPAGGPDRSGEPSG
ncbi:STAS domain-containing protein [Actinoplanes oblitus]|uniref:STAS domain-containing protein n=1 Tax=Actinoplanes oblitus TaxID=3040509 RepID=A0ABY8WR81_9ACTN|nr:STAS domain-containing protein [Actinoplanes oblitus]WIM99350.1 STAS domain-containing protein [Actinoplanes oblitus]